MIALGAGCPSEPPLGFIGDPSVGDPTVPFEGWSTHPGAPGWYAAFPDPMPTPSENDERYVNGGGASFLDLTGDGLPEIVATGPWSGVEVFVNDGNGGFIPASNPELAAVTEVACAVGVHLDDDDLRDLLVCSDNGLRAWRNLGGGSFAFATTVLDLDAVSGRAESVAVTDADGDGVLDLFVSTQTFANQPDGRPEPIADVLLRHVDSFTFEDVSDRLPTGLDGQTWTATWLDLDDQPGLDLLAMRDRGDILWPASLWEQRGDETWEERSAAWDLTLPFDPMGSVQGDLDGDGTTELIFTDNWARLHLRSLQDGVAIERAAELDLVVQEPELQRSSWGLELFDAENDGDLDLLVPFGRVSMLEGDPIQSLGAWLWEDGGFVDVGERIEQPERFEDESWRSCLRGDVEGDGTLEVFCNSQVGAATLLRPNDTRNHWTRVVLRGPPGNRDGLGAKVTLADGSGRARWRQIGIGTTGIGSSREPFAHFGLGAEPPALATVEVRWADGQVSAGVAVLDGVLVVEHPDA